MSDCARCSGRGHTTRSFTLPGSPYIWLENVLCRCWPERFDKALRERERPAAKTGDSDPEKAK